MSKQDPDKLSNISVICEADEEFGSCGQTTRLTMGQYIEQLKAGDKGWQCPRCRVYPCEIIEHDSEEETLPEETRNGVPLKGLEPYFDLINNHGGNPVQELLDRLKNEKGLAQTNIIVYCMALSVECQVKLLATLKSKGLLKEKSIKKDKA